MKMGIVATALLLAAVFLTGCQPKEQHMAAENAVYYWRTTWKLDAAERTFLGRHHIRKVYCRYFDVVMQNGEPMPHATLSFSDSLPAGVELIPTVYITEDCMHERHEALAERLVRRLCQMNETHDIHGVREVQIDCDYTERSRQAYYDFLQAVRQQLQQRQLSLSATIRLHQLAMSPPPVDYGVLMLYNTGDPRKFAEHNPVLDIRDVAPYLKYLADYALPLAAAYPVYRWQRTIFGVRVEHTVDASEILRVKNAVEQRRDELRQTIVTYHLDHENIDRYTHEVYEAIYHH